VERFSEGRLGMGQLVLEFELKLKKLLLLQLTKCPVFNVFDYRKFVSVYSLTKPTVSRHPNHARKTVLEQG